MNALATVTPISQSPKPNRWKGGEVRNGKYVLARMVNGKRYKFTLPKVKTEAEAMNWLARFEADPEGTAFAAKVVKAGKTKAVPTDTWALIPKFIKYLQGECRDERYPDACGKYLQEWQGLLKRDLKDCSLSDLLAAVPKFKAKRKPAVALKSFGRWLITTDKLKADHPVTVLTIQRPGKTKALDKRAYTPEQVVSVYGRLVSQSVKDVFLVKAVLGCHHTEIQRIAKNPESLRVVNQASGIYATLTFEHKSGSHHTVSIGQPVAAAVQRLQTRGSAPTQSTVYWALRAVMEEGETFTLERLRHTCSTLTAESGRVVQPDAGGGVNPELVARMMGHSLKTADKHYRGFGVPLMILPPYAEALYSLSG
jgi:integrase